MFSTLTHVENILCLLGPSTVSRIYQANMAMYKKEHHETVQMDTRQLQPMKSL